MASEIEPGSAAALTDPQRDAFLGALFSLLRRDPGEFAPASARAAATGGPVFALRSAQTDLGLLVRPEFSIDLMAEDLGGQSVLRLLAVQSLLMREMNWWLSAGETGQLLLSPIQWHDDPCTVAACIELAAVLAPSIVGFIATGEPVRLR